MCVYTVGTEIFKMIMHICIKWPNSMEIADIGSEILSRSLQKDHYKISRIDLVNSLAEDVIMVSPSRKLLSDICIYSVVTSPGSRHDFFSERFFQKMYLLNMLYLLYVRKLLKTSVLILDL